VSLWVQNSLVPAVITAAVLLLILWPTRRSGERLLQTWGVPWPQPEQIAEAVRYLWQRRILCVVLFLVVPPLAGLIWRDETQSPGFGIIVPLLVAMLIAELVATIRPVSGIRIAALDRRTWRDLVPRWAVGVVTLLVGLTVAAVVVGLTAGAPVLPALGQVAVCLVVVGLLVRLAVRRPSVADEAVDAALRTRTARVALGIAIGWLGAATLTATRAIYLHEVATRPSDPGLPRTSWLTEDIAMTIQLVGPFVQLAAILCWIWVANPTRRALAASRR
jgi:hypothetical protein